MTRECQVRICERLGVRLPGPTRQVHKAISVLKSRTANHERTIREFSVGSTGIVVGTPLRGFHHVLGGTPAWTGQPTTLTHPANPLA